MSVEDKLQKIRAAEEGDLSLPDCQYLSDDLELRHYQKQMVYHLLLMKRFVVGDATGTGKTLCILGALAHLWEQKGLHLKPVVVTWTSALRQWGSEIDKWMEGVSYKIVDEGPDEREDIYDQFFNEWDQPCVLLINYAKLRRDKRSFMKGAVEEDFVMVYDEVAACKNPSSKTHNKCKEIARHAERCYGLTATLIKNNLEEGYGIYKVIQPGLFGSKRQFMRDYCVTRMQPIGGGKKIPITVGHSKKQVRQFREEIDPYFLGRAKHEVADELPVLTNKKIRVPLKGDQWHYYLQAMEGFLEVNKDADDKEEEVKETTKLTKLIYTQEIANSPYLVGNRGESEKEDYLLDLIEGELREENVIIFTRFKEMINRFQNILENRGYEEGIRKQGDSWKPKTDIDDNKGFVRITGDEDGEQRRAGQEAFQETEDTRIIFLTKAGVEAINLQNARIMIFYDLPWSAGDYLQALGRMIRIGSPHESVYSIHLLSEGPRGEDTIDCHVQDTLDDKMGLIEDVIGERVKEGEAGGDDVFETENEVNEIFEKMRSSAQELKGTDE